ncbi:MAG TPA: Crp/Fnr family transcriptional regulator [Bacillota bacterium]|nr:Crp/Fnr family transcriptional regulator [Bacillota bacterium]
MFHKWNSILSKCPLFQNIPPEELPGMLKCLKAHLKKYRKSEIIVLEGHPLEGIGILLAGAGAVTRESINGGRVMMLLLAPGDIFGEIAAYAEEGRWPATVMAQEESEVLFLPVGRIPSNCERQCSGHRLLLQNMLRIISNRALLLTQKIDYLTRKSLREKIAAYFLDESQRTGQTTFRLPLNRNELADFLSASRPGLSREMARMRDEGLIEFHKESVKIKDIQGLKRLGE